MSLPNKDNLISLDYVHLGQPFVQTQAKASLDTQSLDIVSLAQPFVGAKVDSNVYANINGTWKRADIIYVNINGTWKEINSNKLYVKVGSTWKS
jgi:hypothetical protein